MSRRRYTNVRTPPDVDNDSAILCGDRLPSADHTSSVHETMRRDKKDHTRKDHRRRLCRLAEYWEANNPEHGEVGVVDVSDEERKDPSLHFYNYYKKDLVYRGLNVKCVLEYLAKNKKKSNGKF